MPENKEYLKFLDFDKAQGMVMTSAGLIPFSANYLNYHLRQDGSLSKCSMDIKIPDTLRVATAFRPDMIGEVRDKIECLIPEAAMKTGPLMCIVKRLKRSLKGLSCQFSTGFSVYLSKWRKGQPVWHLQLSHHGPYCAMLPSLRETHRNELELKTTSVESYIKQLDVVGTTVSKSMDLLEKYSKVPVTWRIGISEKGEAPDNATFIFEIMDSNTVFTCVPKNEIEAWRQRQDKLYPTYCKANSIKNTIKNFPRQDEWSHLNQFILGVAFRALPEIFLLPAGKKIKHELMEHFREKERSL
jgi:hypothetical protein